MAFTFGEVRKNLRGKGFREETDRHHIFLRLIVDGKKTHIYTKCSHGANSDDVGHAVASSMKRQLGLDTRQQLNDLVNCPMDYDIYLNILSANGQLSKAR